MTTQEKLKAEKIPLTQERFAIVDAEDYEWLAGFKWHVTGAKKYPYAGWGKKGILMHRLIIGCPLNKCVDHINKNTLDNRKANLRICTKGQNNMNAKPQVGTSMYKGVFFDKSIGYWRAQIRSHGKHYYAKGVFKNELDAARAYDELAEEYHGEFAYLNSPVAA